MIDAADIKVVGLTQCEECGAMVTEILWHDDVPETVCITCAEEIYAEVVAGWHTIDTDIQDDLIDWYNCAEPDTHDKARLAQLYHAGQFISYNCGHCGDKVKQGWPDDWSQFQGCHSDEGAGQLCADCYALYEELKALAD